MQTHIVEKNGRAIQLNFSMAWLHVDPTTEIRIHKRYCSLEKWLDKKKEALRVFLRRSP